MRYLLDTHTWLWFYQNSPRLSSCVNLTIANPQHKCYISVVSIWELAIKISVGKFQLPVPLEDFVAYAEAEGFEILPITAQHATATSEFPFFHRDPFDRMLAAQSKFEGLPLLSTDRIFDRYPVMRIW